MLDCTQPIRRVAAREDDLEEYHFGILEDRGIGETTAGTFYACMEEDEVPWISRPLGVNRWAILRAVVAPFIMCNDVCLVTRCWGGDPPVCHT